MLKVLRKEFSKLRRKGLTGNLINVKIKIFTEISKSRSFSFNHSAEVVFTSFSFLQFQLLLQVSQFYRVTFDIIVTHI
jgi:hypothetical protein